MRKSDEITFPANRVSNINAFCASYSKDIPTHSPWYSMITTSELAAYGGFAPIRGFPAEILVEIFSYHTSSLVGFSGNAEPHLWTELDRLTNTELLALSRVCSRWHSIVFDTPTLVYAAPARDCLAHALCPRENGHIAISCVGTEPERSAFGGGHLRA